MTAKNEISRDRQTRQQSARCSTVARPCSLTQASNTTTDCPPHSGIEPALPGGRARLRVSKGGTFEGSGTLPRSGSGNRTRSGSRKSTRSIRTRRSRPKEPTSGRNAHPRRHGPTPCGRGRCQGCGESASLPNRNIRLAPAEIRLGAATRRSSECHRLGCGATFRPGTRAMRTLQALV